MPKAVRRPCARRAPSLFLATLLLLGLVASGCGDDGVEAPSVQNFARAWHLTKCEYVKEADTAVKADLVANGWTVEFFVNDNGHFLYTATPPVGVQTSYGGTWTVEGAKVVLTREGNSFSWTFTTEVGETSMTMRGAHAEYDFADNGTPEPALWNLAGVNDN
jgi:hypothetical protein